MMLATFSWNLFSLKVAAPAIRHTAGQVLVNISELNHLVVLPVACIIRLDYKARESHLSEETSVTDTNPSSSRDLFR
jgi:hypothetical protein